MGIYNPLSSAREGKKILVTYFKNFMQGQGPHVAINNFDYETISRI